MTAPLYFSGVSTYSSDFQSIIQRAVQIANIPVTNLQNHQATVSSQEQALQGLEPAVAALGADVTALATLAGTQGVSASSSDSNTVSVVNAGATSPATYAVSNITSLASAASETSLRGYTSTQAVSASGHVNLVVGSNTYQLDLTGSGKNNVAGLAQAINNANAGVSASVLTVGSTQYLAISANHTGATTLQLNDLPPASQPPAQLVSSTGTGTETSLQTYSDTSAEAVSQNGHLQLTVGSQLYSLDVSGANNLDGLVNAINSAHAGVIASVSGASGSYTLTVTAPGATNIQITDGAATNLISSTNQGTNASFLLNGVSITKSTNNITDVIPGLSFTLLNETTSSKPVTLTLATDGTQLSDGLQKMVTDYNTLVGQLGAQRGNNAGPLQGNLIINQISSDMQALVSYWNPTGGSTIHSLSDLGITFNYSGQMSFDSGTFDALSDTQISDAFKFIGSGSTGLSALAQNFTQLTDPLNGLIQTQINGYESENVSLAAQIVQAQQHTAKIQQAATAQAQAADALIAQMESQRNAVDASIQSLNYVVYGKQISTSGT
jgi:flagellar hook-associated protein 2